MGKKATKAADNMYYLARYEAAKENDDFTSREKAAEIIGIDNGWYKISVDGKTGYIRSDYMSVTKDALSSRGEKVAAAPAPSLSRRTLTGSVKNRISFCCMIFSLWGSTSSD